MASSRVGTSTRATTPEAGGRARAASTSGMPKAAVLPVPVRAWASRSRPARKCGMACAWMGEGVSYPIAEMASRVPGLSLSSLNDCMDGSWGWAPLPAWLVVAGPRHKGAPALAGGRRRRAPVATPPAEGLPVAWARPGVSAAAKKAACPSRKGPAGGGLGDPGPGVGAQLGRLAVAAGRARLLLEVVGVPAAAAAGDVRAAAAALGGGARSHGTHVGRWARAGWPTRGGLMVVAGA